MHRRHFLLCPVALIAPPCWSAAVQYPRVDAGTPLAFPRDHGSHPAFRTEWWYITGWVRDGNGQDLGVQVTFFRSRPGVAEDLVSAFAPKQLLFAHAALADPRAGRLRHDQRAGRTGFGFVSAAEDTTDVRIGDWSLRLEADEYRARIVARDFAMDLSFRARQPPLLQGTAGVSRKGPRPEQASFYYSRPQLEVSGSLERDGRTEVVTGTAWLDHEWSSEYLAPDAAGWDWIGVNLDDGGALMAFRIRGRDGGVLWAGGAYRSAEGAVRVFTPDEIAFAPVRRWRSARTGIDYPVAMRVTAGGREFVVEPLQDDQELDARATVGIIYWEGAVRVTTGGAAAGRGYLELTGYGDPLRL